MFYDVDILFQNLRDSEALISFTVSFNKQDEAIYLRSTLLLLCFRNGKTDISKTDF